MKRLLPSAMLVVALILTANASLAQPLFLPPGDQRAEVLATTSDPNTSHWVGMDLTGHVYTVTAQYAACWHPEDPAGTRVTLRPASSQTGAFMPNGSVVTLMDHGHEGLRLLGWRSGPSVPTTLKTAIFRCADHEGGVIDDTRFDAYVTTAEVTLDTPLPTWLTAGGTWVARPGGDLCKLTDTTEDTLWCVEVRDIDEGGVTFSKVLELADLVAVLETHGIDPTLRAPTGGVERPTETWRMRLPTWLEDGRMLVVVELRLGTGNTSWGPFAWLLEQTTDGKWHIRYAPPKPRIGSRLNNDSTLQMLTLLTDVDGLDAIVGWPVLHTDWSGEVLRDTENGPVFVGPRGIGAFLLPEDPRATSARTWGWTLPLGEVFRCSPAVDITDNCQEGSGRIGGADGDKLWERFEAIHSRAIRIPDGLAVPTLVGLEEVPNTSGRTRYGLVRLAWNADTLDLDEDGLSREHEQRLGTSDWSDSSDGGALRDGLEVALGRDPADPSDDPARAHSPVYWAESRLVERFLADRIAPDHGLLGGYGPLCHTTTGALECHLQNGDLVDYGDFATRTDESPILRIWHSQDGTFIVVRREEGLIAIDHHTGHEDLLVPDTTLEAELAALPSSGGWATDLTVVASDRDTIFVAFTGVTDVDQARVHVVDPDAPTGLRLVYDHTQARCDSRMGPCDDRTPPTSSLRSVPQNDLSTRGYGSSGLLIGGVLPGPRRLMVSVLGRYGRWTLGIHPEDPPIVLRYGDELAYLGGLLGLPRYILPTGHGDFTTGPGFMDAFGNPIGTTVERAGPWDTPPTVLPPHHLGLADTGVIFTQDTNRRAYEYVPYATFSADPGDVFTLVDEPFEHALGAPRDARWRLFRSGPRGGLAPVWDYALGSVELRSPTGMDINHRGELCLADKHLGRLRVFIPNPGSLAPRRPHFDYALTEGATDCLMEDDGTVWVLQDRGPTPRVARYELFTEEPLEVVAVTATDPVGLVRTPDGGFEVLDRAAPGPGSHGRLYLQSGERLDLEPSLCVGLRDATPWRVFGVERPDGWLVVSCLSETPSGLISRGGDTIVLHPETGQSFPLSSNQTRASTFLLARMPGGARVDPWTGDTLDSATLPTLPPTLAAPAPPTDGTPVATTLIPDDGGCASGHPSLLSVLTLLLLLGLRPRPRTR